jgi:hypothetical protein
VHDLLEIQHNRTTHFNFAFRERERERERERVCKRIKRELWEATSQLKASNHQLMEPKKTL